MTYAHADSNDTNPHLLVQAGEGEEAALAVDLGDLAIEELSEVKCTRGIADSEYSVCELAVLDTEVVDASCRSPPSVSVLTLTFWLLHCKSYLGLCVGSLGWGIR